MSDNRIFRDSSRDVWSHGSGRQLRDLLSSALSTLLMMGEEVRPAYFSSPWMSDFVLFDNHFREYEALFPDLADQTELRFSDYLARLSGKLPVRIITTRSDTSESFISKLRAHGVSRVQCRFAESEYHEKGILAPSFYIEGSMNITYSGVYVRGEKITYHTNSDAQGASKIASAYLEYDRRWNNLA
jgi:hypothetical protein